MTELVKKHERAHGNAAVLNERARVLTPSSSVFEDKSFEEGVSDRDLLSMEYPAFASKIKMARGMGFSDNDIRGGIERRRDEALNMGFPVPEVNEALGVTNQSRRAYIGAVLKGRDKLDASLMGLTPEQLEQTYGQAIKAGMTIDEAKKATSRRLLTHKWDMGLLNDYIDIADEKKAAGPAPAQHEGGYHADMGGDVGPRFEWNKDFNEAAAQVRDTTYKRTIGGLAIGYLASTEGIIRGGAYLSHIAGWNTGYDYASSLADVIAEGNEGLARANYAGREQDLWDMVMQGGGSMAAFMLPGMMASKLLSIGAGARNITVGKRFAMSLAHLTGAGVQASAESLSEAGSVFEDIYKRTGDEQAASTGATWTFWLNMPLNFLTDKAAFFGDDNFLKKFMPGVLKGAPLMQNVLYRAAKTAASAVSEGTQETVQGAISEHYGNDTDWTAIDLSKIAYEQGIPGAIVGAITGGFANRESFRKMSERLDTETRRANARKEIRERLPRMRARAEVYAQAEKAYTDAGASPMEAKLAAGLMTARAENAAKKEGISPKQWYANLKLVGESIGIVSKTANVYYQPVNSNVDVNREVRVVDLVGEDGRGVSYEDLRKFISDISPASITTADNNAVVAILKGNADHISHSSRAFYNDEGAGAARKSAVLNIRDLASASVMIESVPNSKKIEITEDMSRGQRKKANRKNSVEFYHRLYVPVRTSDGNVYAVRLVVTEKGGAVNLVPKQTELYDVTVDKKLEGVQEKPPTQNDLLSGGSQAPSNDGALSEERDIPSKLSIHDMLKNVRDSGGNMYFAADNRQVASEAGVKGYVEFVKKSGKTVMGLIQGSEDAGTVIHETGHVFLEDFRRFIASGAASEADMADWKTLSDWLGVSDWNTIAPEALTAAHEKFANGFIRYVYEGVAPSRGLAKIFSQFRAWMIEAFKGSDAAGVELSDEVRGVYDRLLGMDDEASEYVGRKAEDVIMQEEGERDFSGRGDEANLADEKLPEYPDDWTDEEIAAYQEFYDKTSREMYAEDDLYDPEMWYEGHNPAAEDIDKMLVDEEKGQLAREEWDAWKNFGKDILSHGGLQYESLKKAIGEEAAADVYKRAQGLFRKTVMEVADVASDMGLSINDITERIMGRPERPVHQQLAPVVGVDVTSLTWLIDRLGEGGAYSYLKRRGAYIERQISDMSEQYLAARDEGNESAKAYFANETKLLVQEQETITKAMAALEPRAAAGAEEKPLPAWPEIWKMMKNQAARWTQQTVGEAIDEVTGKTVVGDLISEREAYNRALQMVEAESKRAWRAGAKEAKAEAQVKINEVRAKISVARKEGFMQAKARADAINKRLADKETVRGEIKKIVTVINKEAKSDSIIWAKKMEIQQLLEGYDLRFKSKNSIYNQEQINDYVHDGTARESKTGEAFDPGGIDIDEVGARTLNNIALEDLRALGEKVELLFNEGRDAYELWRAARQQEKEETAAEIIKAAGGPKGTGEGVIVPGETQQGKKEGIFTLAWLKAQTPSRVFDMMDNFADFKGTFHNLFQRRADAAEDAFLRAKNARYDNMREIIDAYEITPQKLGEKLVEYDGVDGKKHGFSRNECMSIYIGWHNPKTRDALMYGNHITPDLAERAIGALSESDKSFAVEVTREQGGENSARYDAAMKTAFNIGIVPEDYYMRMYRTTWTDGKTGEVIDEGIKGQEDDLARQYGLSKLYSDRGSSYNRKNISERYQAPISLGLMNTWQRAMEEHEHFIAYGNLVKELHAVLSEKTDKSGAEDMPGVRATIQNRYGNETAQWLTQYVNGLACPDWYKTYKASDQYIRAVRANAGMAYLWGNIATAIKQPQALVYYLRYSGLKSFFTSIAEFTAHPIELTHQVWELDPQVKDQKINPALELIKARDSNQWMEAGSKMKEIGFLPMELTDMMTRVIGWNAVYKHELEMGATPEDARYAAQRATLNTQNAAHVKELPSYMKSSHEYFNLFTQFTNQANKIFGLTTHELYGDFKHGRLNKGFMTMLSLFLGAWLMSMLKYGEEPISSGEGFKRLILEETAGNIPLLGSAISMGGAFRGATTPFDDAISEVFRGTKRACEGDTEQALLSLYTATSLLWAGLPVTAVKRTLMFMETGELSDMTGLFRPSKRKKKGLYF